MVPRLSGSFVFFFQPHQAPAAGPFPESVRNVAERVRRVLMSRRTNYRDGLDATAAPGAGPAGSVEQEAADFPLQARSHLAPLTAPHNPC